MRRSHTLLRVQATGTVTFFLYFDDLEHADHAHAALVADGFAPRAPDPPEEGDASWSLLADRELGEDEVEAAVERARAIAAASGGHLDGLATPWPGHPAASPPRR
jgi:hypothetical protein